MAKKEKNILNDIMQYCARSEHCTQDVVIKLKSWEVEEEEIDGILQQLRAENFLDDARYAKAYVNDKWKLDHWGKKKIRNKLFLKNIDDSLIQPPLDAIDEEEYRAELAAQLSRKEKDLESNEKSLIVNKLYNFAVSRGFEEVLIMKWLNERKNKK